MEIDVEMLYMSAFSDKYLDREIAADDNAELLREALKNFDTGEINHGHKICDKLKDNSALAVLLGALFSKEEESEEQFELRHLSDLSCAANSGNSLAQYSLAVYYDRGDMVEEDKRKAEYLYRAASEGGLPIACHLYGIILYNGSDFTEMDREKGLELLRYAVNEGVDDAKTFLNSLC